MNKNIIMPEVNEFTLGQLIMLFEMQTAFAGEMLGIDAFDQPGVEEGKNATYALLGKPGYEAKLDELKNAEEAKKNSSFDAADKKCGAGKRLFVSHRRSCKHINTKGMPKPFVGAARLLNEPF